MTLKTDKRSSLDHVMHYIDRKAEFGKTIPVAKARRAAQYAFSAGRESVVENMPELEWKGIEYFQYADTYFGRYNIDNFGMWLLRFNGVEIPLPIGNTLEDAKQAANEDYKQRIKQALGL